MSRRVHCRKYDQDMEGLDAPPFPGPKGQEIYDSVSKQAWQEWLAHQTMLINEKRLNLMDAATKSYLAEQRDRFLANQDVEQAEGYVPPEQ